MELKNKICIITGATSGIGKVTAIALAKKEMQLILPVRNMEKGERVKKEISELTGNNNIRLIYCDLESLDAVRKFAEDFKKDYNQLDLLINNAGTWFTTREVTIDGYEKNFAINYLSHFLLTMLLLETIKNTEKARIISLSSEAHRFTNMNFDDLQSEKNFNNFKAYGQSKLAFILFTKKLSELLKGTGITANCLHPGIVSTNLFDKMGGFMKSIFQMFMITSEKGAATTIYLATSDVVENISGEYFKKKKVARSTAYSYNKEAAEKLWDMSLKMVGL